MRRFAILALIIAVTSATLTGCGSSSTLPTGGTEKSKTNSSNPGNVGRVINSTTDDYAPKFIGNTLVYSSGVSVEGKYPKSTKAEFIVAEHSGDLNPQTPMNTGWSKPKLLGVAPYEGVSLDLNEGAMDILPEKHYAVFAAEREMPAGGESSLMELYEVNVDDQFHATSKPQPLTNVNDPDSWDSQPALTPDGNTLFFTSDRPINGGTTRGTQHIWRSDRTNGVWGKPHLLDHPYTTSGNDVSPFVGPDGYFYFSSDGNPDGKTAPAGMGGRDIYRVEFTNGQPVGDPERLAAPFNSPKDDDFPYVTKDRKSFWLSSNRDGGNGERDIYAFPVPAVIKLEGRVTQSIETDSGYGAPGGVQMTLWIDDLTAHRHYNVQTNNIGEYEVILKPDHEYTVSVADSGCANASGMTTVTAYRPYNWDTTYTRNFNLERHTITISLGKNSDVPFFITGYWRPNTPENLSAFKSRKANDTKFSSIVYINPTDYDYDAGSRKVEAIFEKDIYEPVRDSILPLMNTACYDSNYIIHLNVDGYTDKDCITPDHYYDEDVIGGEIAIHNGDLMDGPECGNRKLSILRAYFTMLDIKQHLMQDIRFANFVNQNRIKFTFHGRGIDHTIKSNLGFNRRVDVTAELERR
jgi:hypothetical protein